RYARALQARNHRREHHVDPGSTILPEIPFVVEVRGQTDSVLEASIEDGENRSRILVRAWIVRLARMVEAEVGAAFCDGDGGGRRVVADVVQMSDHDVVEVDARALEEIDLVERALGAPAGDVGDDRQ